MCSSDSDRADLRRRSIGFVAFRTVNRQASPSRLKGSMCRNIKTLANFEPPATHDEIRASALQFVRKLSGTTHPSGANEAAFNLAVEEVTDAATRLINSLETKSAPRDRSEEARKAKERAAKRYA